MDVVFNKVQSQSGKQRHGENVVYLPEKNHNYRPKFDTSYASILRSSPDNFFCFFVLLFSFSWLSLLRLIHQVRACRFCAYNSTTSNHHCPHNHHLSSTPNPRRLRVIKDSQRLPPTDPDRSIQPSAIGPPNVNQMQKQI